ncbi:endonuclease MutS2 [bacterium]|nr:endonuclease MutS2 [bacterium]
MDNWYLHSSSVLELLKVKGLLQEYCVSPMAKQRAADLSPLNSREEAGWSFSFISEIKRMLQQSHNPNLHGLHDIREYCSKAAKQGILNEEQLWKVMEVLCLTEQLIRLIRKSNDEYPMLRVFLSNLITLIPLDSQIERFLQAPGEIRENATPTLVNLNKQYEIVRERIQGKLEGYLNSRKFSGYLQEPLVTFRQGRFVIPVQAVHKERIPGVIHDRSASGATLFVEPFTVVSFNNELREIELKIKAEKERILRFLSQLIGAKADTINSNVDYLATLDFYTAAAHLSQRYDAGAPDFSKNGDFILKRAYHPLLLEERYKDPEFKPIHLDLELKGAINALIITGPNMGGKTVTLKTIGLLSMMAVMGLHIPAANGTTMPFFKKIFADIGDEQSIEFSLSSFASHIKHWCEALDGAGPDSLVLLDELGSSTAPEEGAPLSIALLNKLVKKKARIIATTHLGTLKTLAAQRPEFDNAAMEFDPDNLNPTYQLRMGAPGRSWAFQIAQVLGLPQEIITSGYQLLSQEEVKIDNLTRELEEQITTLQKKNDQVSGYLQELEGQKMMLEGLLKSNKEKEEILLRLKKRYEKEKNEMLKDFLEKERHRLRILLPDSNDKETLHRAIETVEDNLKKVKKKQDRFRKINYEFREGQHVNIIFMDKEGEILSLPDKSGYLKILVDGYQMNIHGSELEPLKEDKKPQQKQIFYKERKPPESLNLLGLHFAEAQEKIDQYIDDAIVKEKNDLLIIHGKKVLKDKVRAYLRNNKRVESIEPAELWEGGDGATVVKLKI